MKKTTENPLRETIYSRYKENTRAFRDGLTRLLSSTFALLLVSSCGQEHRNRFPNPWRPYHLEVESLAADFAIKTTISREAAKLLTRNVIVGTFYEVGSDAAKDSVKDRSEHFRRYHSICQEKILAQTLQASWRRHQRSTYTLAPLQSLAWHMKDEVAPEKRLFAPKNSWDEGSNLAKISDRCLHG
jgi:hypothetical protein